MDSHIKRKKISTKRKLEQSADIKKKIKTDIWDRYRYTDTDIQEMNNLIEKYKPNTDTLINKRTTRLNIKNRDTIKNSKMLGWVSATKIKYYLLNDTCIDWLNLYHNKINPCMKVDGSILKEAEHIELLFEGGNRFEEHIYKELESMIGSDFKIVFDNNKINSFLKDRCIDGILREGYGDVKKYMDMGIPIIAQAPLINDNNKTYGIADLIVRTDYLEVLFNIFEPDNEIYISAPNLKYKKYHYRVIDIKWTTLLLCTDGKTLRNQDLFPAYKGQLALYSAALEQLQGYIPNYAYIMGKSWKICKSDVGTNEHLYKGYSSFDRLGIINYTGRDEQYVELTKKAIQWVQRVSTEGKEWNYDDDKPSVIEMYPNMKKNINPAYDKIKTQLADRYGELSLCWNLSNNARNIGHRNGITDIRSDECTLEKLEIKPEGRGNIIEKIININRYSQTKDIIRPKYIKNNMKNWKEYNKLDIYIDFETINYNLYTNPDTMNIDNSYNDTDVAFMIGIGYEYIDKIDTGKIISSLLIDKSKCNTRISLKNNWEYVCFYLTDFKVRNEMELFRLLFQFVILREDIYNKLNNSNIKTRLFHWTNAELNIYNKAIDRIQNGEYTEHYLSNKNIICDRNNKKFVYNEMLKLISQFDSNIVWVDMCDIFQKEPIVIKGSFRFKLKHIGNAFYDNGLINTKWNNDNMSDGFKAMIKAIELYRENDIMTSSNRYFKQIINYNEVDCKIIWEIVRYLRNNH